MVGICGCTCIIRAAVKRAGEGVKNGWDKWMEQGGNEVWEGCMHVAKNNGQDVYLHAVNEAGRLFLSGKPDEVVNERSGTASSIRNG